MKKTSTRILMVALVSAALLTALAVNQTIGASAVQKTQTTQEPAEQNEYSQSDTEHPNTHVPTFAANNKLNQAKVAEFRAALRDLWVDHIVWTRQFIVDVANDLPSLDDTTHRLLKNQDDIGNAVKPYYGDEAGNKLTDLLKQHILIAADLADAAKSGNQSAIRDADARWTQNADDIAHFLASANPNWNEDDLKTMMHEHLSATKSEAVARLQGDYTADIAAFDEVHAQAMQMADMLSSGIVQQFPKSFED